MSDIIIGDRGVLSGPITEHRSCTVGRDGEITATTLDWVCYHRSPGQRGPVYVLGRDASDRDLLAVDVRGLADLVDAADRSGRVRPLPEPVDRPEPAPVGEIL